MILRALSSLWQTACLCLMMLGLLVASSYATSYAARSYPAQRTAGAQLQKAILSAHIISSDYRVNVSVKGPEAAVVTYRNPRAAERDMKIDAVLIAKRIMDVSPSIACVRSRFYEIGTGCQYFQVEVHAGDIAAFARGVEDREKLLASLPLTDSQAGACVNSNQDYSTLVSNYEVVGGYGRQQRTRLLEQLLKIEQLGGECAGFWRPFLAIEDAARLGDDRKILAQVRALGDRLSWSLQNSCRQNPLLPRRILQRRILDRRIVHVGSLDSLTLHSRILHSRIWQCRLPHKGIPDRRISVRDILLIRPSLIRC